MNAFPGKTGNTSTFASPHGVDYARAQRAAQTALQFANWGRRSAQWGCLMAAAQRGERQAYEQLLRELDAWLRRYYARRLPATAAEDARQDALLAIHSKRHVYAPSKPFGPWVAAIARHKWIDHVRKASRFAALPLHDLQTEDRGEPAISAAVLHDLLSWLKPAQARVIRLVKLQGVSIEAASIATGQSPALVKVNIHRGLKKLAALAIGDATALMTAAHSSRHRRRSAACRADDEAVPQNSPQPFSSRLILPSACRTTPSARAAGRDR